jgi:hypothetical protein
MKKKVTILLSMTVLLLFILMVTGCVEKRFKEILTDASGSAEEIVVISQSAKLVFTDFTVSKVNCGSNMKIQIMISNRDVNRDNFILVDKGQLIQDLKPVNVRSGDRIKMKVTDGCPNGKYVVNFTLDSGS